jgi:hypothetical protein
MNLLMKNDLIECLGISPRVYKSTAKQLQSELEELTV